MKAIEKVSKQVHGIVEEQTVMNRHILRFCNSDDTLWKGNKRFAH